MPAYFGLDIGSYSIKAVQVNKARGGWELLAAGEILTPANINSTQPEAKQKLIEAIKKLIIHAEIKAKKVIIALPESFVFSRVIELPLLSPQELATAISFEAEQYIPVPLSEVQIEYLIIETPPKGSMAKKMKVLLIAARKSAVNSIVGTIQASGLTPVAMETEILAIERIASFSKKNALIVNLGYKSTELIISIGGKIRFIRSLNTAGEALTRSLSQNLGMEFAQAEQYKNTYGLDETKLEGKVAKAIMPALNTIIAEAKKSVDFFQQQSPGSKVEMIILSGGGATMIGISAVFANLFNLEASILDPFANFVDNEKLKTLHRRQQFIVATGLAIRKG